jgi:RHS repeat-associated protein
MKEQSENKASSNFLKTDGGKTKSNAIEIPSINLPKGGGAIKGIDEKFSVNTVNGTASFSIPLPFSPARGASPALNLSYNSGSGNGIFGLGWNISLPSIKRKTDKGLPQYFDNTDADIFLFSEAEDLVPEFEKENGSFKLKDGEYIIFEKDFPHDAPHTHKIRFYKPRIEGLLARIELWTEITTGSIKWRVITKDNTTTLFGWSSQSRIADPEDENRIYEWLPEFVFDDKGNCSQYIYEGENISGLDTDSLHDKNRIKNTGLTYTNRYLKKILYGNMTPYAGFNTAFPAADKYLFETVFDYGMPGERPDIVNAAERRTDSFSDYKAGFEIRTTRLCKRVLLFHHFKEPGEYDGLVKSLNFDYDTRTQNNFTFLKTITAYGYIKKDHTYSQKNLPPTEFTYQQIEWNNIKDVKTITTENLVHAPSGLDEQQYQFTDLFNEGLSGILTEQAGGWYYKHNLGNGEFENAKLISPKPSFNGLGSHLQLADLDANGGKQLVNYATEPKGYFELTDEEQWQPFKNFRNLPNINLNDSNTRMLDLNGDGKAEILISEDNVFTWYESEGKNGFKNIYHTEKSFDEETGPAVVFADSTQSIFLADMSGDGLSDIVRIRNGEVCYWPNMGYGKFGAKVQMDDSPVFDFADAFNPAYLRLADIDGSGTTDIIYLGKNKFTCWSNLSGNAFHTVPFEMEAFPDIHNQAKITVTDLLGNGVACIVWSSPLAKDAQSPLRYIDLMNSKKPHIMIGYKNNMGKEVTMEYKPSTHFYLADKKAGNPWITKLHFPVHCVVKTIVTDNWRKTKFATTYSYHHGYYDHAEKEFRGFGRVEQIDVEDFGSFLKGNVNSPYITDDYTLYQPPVKTISWYHTGAFLEREKILNQFKHEYFAPTSAEFSEHILPEPDMSSTTLSTQEWQEALRACKGMLLRQEVYELDVDTINTPAEKRVKLFSTAFHNCHIRLLQPKENSRHAIFLVTESEAITYNYELDLLSLPLQPDPRIAHTLNLDIDEYGNVKESVAIAYPRVGRHSDSTLPDGAEDLIASVQRNEIHIAYTQNRFTILEITISNDENQHRLPLLCETKTYEITGFEKKYYYTLKELRDLSIATLPKKEYHELPEGATKQKRIVEHVRILYFNNDLQTPLPFGIHNFLALLYETYKLALTATLLQATLGSKLSTLKINNAETHDALLHRILPAGGYHFKDNAWWIRSGIAGFNSDAATHFYLPEKYTDPFGNETTLDFDAYDLFIQKSKDALFNETKVTRFDYRVLAPLEVKDINNNLSEVVFDIWGMPAALAIKGKGNEGDKLDNVTTEIDEATLISFFTNSTYDETATRNFLGNTSACYVYYLGEKTEHGNISYGKHPAAVAAITREKHVAQLVAGEESDLHIAFQYADGSGAVIATKAQAEPETEGGALRWITNGKTILNNKGKPVKQYEPYFTETHVYAEPEEVGVTSIMYYDAPGRLIRTEMPDGSYSRLEFTPWYMSAYDQNDTLIEHNNKWYLDNSTSVDVAKQTAAKEALVYTNTPAQTFLDSLGREVIAIAHNKWKTVDDFGTATTHEEKYLTYTKLDAEGKPLWIKDARGNLVMQYVFPYAIDNRTEPTNYVPCYDIAGNLLFQHSMDAGDKWMINDAAGKPFYSWDNRAQTIKMEYDKLHRPTKTWLHKNSTPSPILVGLEIYGENILVNGKTDIQLNLRGKAFKHYDQSGCITNTDYDFKENLLTVHRRLSKEIKTGNSYQTEIDWNVPDTNTLLEAEAFEQTTVYNALNRMTLLNSWHNATISASIYTPEYNKQGALKAEKLEIRGELKPIIKNIAYNAKGQKLKITYGNETVTKYTYDEKTFRLLNLKTTGKIITDIDPFTIETIQDLSYTYDAVGNITSIKDKAQPTIYFRNTVVEAHSTYQYDALYRLIKAIGREHEGQNSLPPSHDDTLRTNLSHPGDGNKMGTYTERYQYDSVGNILMMRHHSSNATQSWKRQYQYALTSNRLLATQGDEDNSKPFYYNTSFLAEQYSYNIHGSITAMPHLQQLDWDFTEHLQHIKNGTLEAWYRYDAQKQRSRKIAAHSSIKEERIYLGGLEIYRKWDSNGKLEEQIETTQLLDGSQRVILVEHISTLAHKPVSTLLYRYQYSNHLGSVSVELNHENKIISYEEYHPYGTTAYQAVDKTINTNAKRYRYTDMERDEETGLAYHTARYYLPWLGRWLSADPIGIEGGLNLFVYVMGSPLQRNDRSGCVDVKINLLGGDPKTWNVAPYTKQPDAPGLIAEHSIPGKAIYWGLVERFGTGYANEVYQKLYNTMTTVLIPKKMENIKTPKDLSFIATEFRNPVQDGRSSDMSKLIPFSVQNLFDAAKKSNTDLSPKAIAAFNKQINSQGRQILGALLNGDAFKRAEIQTNAFLLANQMRQKYTLMGIAKEFVGAGVQNAVKFANTSVKIFASSLIPGYEEIASVGGGSFLAGARFLINPKVIAATSRLTINAFGSTAISATSSLATSTISAFSANSLGTIAAGGAGAVGVAVAAVAVAGAAGYGLGTVINSHLSDETQMAIGGTINEIVEHGFENVKNFWF